MRTGVVLLHCGSPSVSAPVPGRASCFGARRVGEGEEVARRQAAGPYRPLLRALRRRRRLRASLVQLAYVVTLFALSVALSHIGTGPMVPATTIVPMLFALAGALVSFIAIVYSLLFLVVQWASSAYSPRLHLFRDHPSCGTASAFRRHDRLLHRGWARAG